MPTSPRTIQKLTVYPLKSASGQDLKVMNIFADGPEGDRQWMLVDSEGKFLSQRTVPKLATIYTHVSDLGLTIGYNNQFFRVPMKEPSRRLTVQIWRDTVEVALEPDLYSQALSQYLGVPCRLVRSLAGARKISPQEGAEVGWQPEVRFADSRPLLLVNTASFEDLNGRLYEKITMDRFRGNVVFNGHEAFEEESWKKIRLGSVVFSQPKKCSRCVMINRDQRTGHDAGGEPLKVLSSYRRDGDKVIFGVLWIPEGPGTLSIGDKLEVIESL